MAKKDHLQPVAFLADAQFATHSPDDKGPRSFSAVAYGGGVVTDHPFFDRVAFDLSTTKLATPAPALYAHRDPIGVIATSEISNNIRITGKVFSDVDSPDAKRVTQFADRGMPWQMSVGIWPGRVDEIKAGAKVQLNGQEFEGPLTVFRDNRVREVSFCALGADGSTSSQIFTIGGSGNARVDHSTDGEEMETIAKSEHDRIVAELNARVTKAEADLNTLREKFAADAKTRRIADVKSLFSELGKEFKDDATAAPYLGMTDEAFAAYSADMRASKPKLDPSLTQEHATQGAGGSDTTVAPKTAADFAAAARKYIAEQKALGVDVNLAQAMTHVNRTFAAAAKA